MHCARCGFRLVRAVLQASTGLVAAGDSSPARCPNSCGPLWPVTWEQEAREAQRLAEQLLDRAVAAETAHRLADDGWKREAEDLDAVLRLVGLDPEACRSEGGNLMLTRVRHELALKARQQAEIAGSK